ncbi:ABC transporter substrate-binding protein [Pseudonocardia lacus]|uniref:ABC transporter substrate-binding protein n=1 Tax=Pseudonocardia lacus TaxID=2835865 RepID=UPI001BDD4B5C|nr:ABC transporter substrate-binding protein [Pseudonocardia lacus]
MFAYAIGPSTLDPAKNVQRGGADIYLLPLYDRLTRLGPKGEVEPMLATAWEFAPDGSALTLTLRPDATFADGSKVDAAAVKANLDRMRTIPGGISVQSLQVITEITAPDPGTVVIGLQKGSGAQLPVLFAENTGMIMNPKAFADPAADLTTSIGVGNESGPYTLAGMQPGPGGKINYTRRADIADYWDKDAAKIAELEWLNIPTAAQRINAAQAGDITMGQVTGVDVARAKQLVESGQVAGMFFRQPKINQELWLQASRPPLDNVKVRQAIQAAIDRNAINEGLFNGDCTPTIQDYPEGQHWASSPALAQIPPADPEKARRLIAESGVGTPKFTLYAAETWKAQGQAVQQALRDVGMDVELAVDTRTPGGPTFAKGDFDAQQGAFVGSSDPAQLVTDLYFGNINLVPEADRAPYEPLLAQLGDPLLSQDQRAKVFDEMAQMLYEGAYSVPMCYGSQVWLTDGSVGNLETMPGTDIGLVDVRYLYVTAK